MSRDCPQTWVQGSRLDLVRFGRDGCHESVTYHSCLAGTCLTPRSAGWRCVKRRSSRADNRVVRLFRRLAVPLALTAIGFATFDGWTAIVFFAAAAVWTLGVATDLWILPALGVFRQADKWSRRLIAVEATTLFVWTTWGLYEAFVGRPRLSFASFGFVSLPVGALLLVLSLVGLAIASIEGRPKRYGVVAAGLGFAIGVLPFAALVTLYGDSMS